eukprot:4153312-Pleurochrysis_carterae.AAC.3
MFDMGLLVMRMYQSFRLSSYDMPRTLLSASLASLVHLALCVCGTLPHHFYFSLLPRALSSPSYILPLTTPYTFLSLAFTSSLHSISASDGISFPRSRQPLISIARSVSRSSTRDTTAAAAESRLQLRTQLGVIDASKFLLRPRLSQRRQVPASSLNRPPPIRLTVKAQTSRVKDLKGNLE